MYETVLKLEKTIHQDLLNVSVGDSRNLLNHILQNAVETGQQIQLLLEKNSQDNNDVLLNLQQINQRELSRDERECLQALCLDPPYSDFKDVIHERVEGTCMWFLSQQAYKDWIDEPEGCLLVSADPGRGKSVLTKFLIEHELPRACPGTIICYFFFKDQIQNKLCMALCGLLHQLLDAEPRLIKHAQAKFHRHGLKLQGNAQALFEILADALTDPISVPVIFVLDAMDECDEGDCGKLFRALKTLQLRIKTGTGKLKMLLTSRPYHNIIFDFEADNPSFDLLQLSSEPEALFRSGLVEDDLPEGWEARISKKGHVYFANHNTGSTTYNDPRNNGLPAGWDLLYKKESNRLIPYFADHNTQTITRDDPRLLLSGNLTIVTSAQNDPIQPLTTNNNIRHHHSESKRIHIPGELESEVIGWEVNLVIKHRLQELCQRGTLREIVRANLEKQLLSQSNRTYLWVYFLFDELQHMITPTWKETERKLIILPTSLNEAYERILSRCAVNEEVKQHAIRTLCVMLAAKRPLSLQEVQIAARIEFDPPSSQHEGLDLENDKEFATKLRNWCGLFVQVYKHQVTFIHQTGREFLLAKKAFSSQTPSSRAWRWQGFTSLEYAHRVIAQCCMIYLGLTHESITSLHKLRRSKKRWAEDFQRTRLISKLHFLGYAAWNWDWHFLEGHCEETDKLFQLAFQMCDPDSIACAAWSSLKYQHYPSHHFSHRLVIATSLRPGLLPILLAKGYATDQLDDKIYKRIFLEAARSGHETIMKSILSHGINVNECTNRDGTTALHITDSRSCIEFLLERGAHIDIQDRRGETPLHRAIVKEGIEIAKLLIQHGASTTIPNSYGYDALFYAVLVNNVDFVQLILNHNPDLNVHHKEERDILIIAGIFGDKQIVKILLEHGAKVNMQDSYGSTTLHFAADRGHQGTVQLLLDNSADPSILDDDCSAAQDLAVIRGHTRIVKILHGTAKPTVRRSSLSDLWPMKPYWDRAQNGPGKTTYNKARRKPSKMEDYNVATSELILLNMHKQQERLARNLQSKVEDYNAATSELILLNMYKQQERLARNLQYSADQA